MQVQRIQNDNYTSFKRSKPNTQNNYMKSERININTAEKCMKKQGLTNLQKLKRGINIGIVAAGCVLLFPALLLMTWWQDKKTGNPSYPV